MLITLINSYGLVHYSVANTLQPTIRACWCMVPLDALRVVPDIALDSTHDEEVYTYSIVHVSTKW